MRRLRADPPQPRVVFLRKIGGAREDEDLAKSQLALPRPDRSPGREGPGHEEAGTGDHPEVEFANEKDGAGHQTGTAGIKSTSRNPSRSGWAGTQKNKQVQ